MRIFILFTFLTTSIVYAQTQPTNEYVVNQAVGKEYKLVYQAQVWSTAKQMCEQEGARLAVPKTQEEFQFIQKLVRGMYYPDVTGTSYKYLAWVGINNLENYMVWKNLEGQDIEDSDFHTFSGNNGNGFSDNPEEPHCVGVDSVNPGLRDWWCHRQQPYICEKSVSINQSTKQ